MERIWAREIDRLWSLLATTNNVETFTAIFRQMAELEVVLAEYRQS